MESAADVFIEISASTCGGILGKLVDFGPDTVKVRYQSLAAVVPGNQSSVKALNISPSASSLSSSSQKPLTISNNNITTFQVAKQMWQNEGIRAFYAGISAPLFGAAFDKATAFLSYQYAKSYLAKHHYFDAHRKKELSVSPNNNKSSSALQQTKISAAAGAFSGFAAGIVQTPAELIKIKVQSRPDKFPTAAIALKKTFVAAPTWRSVPSYLFQGGATTIGICVFGNCFWFVTYEETLTRLQSTLSLSSRSQLPWWSSMAAGGLGGMVFWMAVFPLDTVKTIIQRSDHPFDVRFTSTMRSIVKHNPKSLFNGLGITVARSIPANAAVGFGYEKMKQFCGAK